MKGNDFMATGRIVKASNHNYCKMTNVPDEVVKFFNELSDKYEHNDFIVEIGPDTYKEGTEASIEFMIYDDYVE